LAGTQGANQALIDALIISEALHRHLSLNRSSWIKVPVRAASANACA
jgi:hypothetical protein